MHSLLEKLLRKRGIKDYQDLDEPEKETFDNWNAQLSKEELNLEDVKEFCKTQVAVIEGKWSNLDTENTRKAELIPYHTVYKAILTAINSPRSARTQLEKQLIELTK